mmetsp:Transcript_87569/g.231761  ORF Transcript_87569/g.231761 Transcript_87569/m.231761 type:complete len:232 (+) Transcript_87569:123-818(+)
MRASSWKVGESQTILTCSSWSLLMLWSSVDILCLAGMKLEPIQTTTRSPSAGLTPTKSISILISFTGSSWLAQPSQLMKDAMPSSVQPRGNLSGACSALERNRDLLLIIAVDLAASFLRTVPIMSSTSFSVWFAHQISGHLLRRWNALRRAIICESPTKMCFVLPWKRSFMQSDFRMAASGPVICKASSAYPAPCNWAKYVAGSQLAASSILSVGIGKPFAPRSKQNSLLN